MDEDLLKQIAETGIHPHILDMVGGDAARAQQSLSFLFSGFEALQSQRPDWESEKVARAFYSRLNQAAPQLGMTLEASRWIAGQVDMLDARKMAGQMSGEGSEDDEEWAAANQGMSDSRYPMSPAAFREMRFTRRAIIDLDPNSPTYGQNMGTVEGNQEDIFLRPFVQQMYESNLVTPEKERLQGWLDSAGTSAATDVRTTQYGEATIGHLMDRQQAIEESRSGARWLLSPNKDFKPVEGIYTLPQLFGSAYQKELKSGDTYVQPRIPKGLPGGGQFVSPVQDKLIEVGALLKQMLLENYKTLGIENRPTSSLEQTGALRKAIEGATVEVSKSAVRVELAGLDQERPHRPREGGVPPTVGQIARWVFFGRRGLDASDLKEKQFYMFGTKGLGGPVITKTVRPSEPLNIFKLSQDQKRRLRKALLGGA